MATKKTGKELREEALAKINKLEDEIKEAKREYSEILSKHPYETTKQLTPHEIRLKMRKTGVDDADKKAQEKLTEVKEKTAQKG